jgi:carbon-monoxide dehydrogenase medium subunit
MIHSQRPPDEHEQRGTCVKPAAFEYHAPESTSDVVALLREHGDDAKVLAGGQSLVPMLALRLTRFPHLVDVNRVRELDGVEQQNGMLGVGAVTRQSTIERSATVPEAVPLLAKSVKLIGHFQIRNRGTVGGSIAHADPAAELPAVALTLDAELEVANADGTRRIPASEFFVSTWTTSLEPDDLLVRTWFPVASGRSGFAFEEVARRLGDFGLAGAAAAIELGDDDTITKANIGLLGMGPTPLRARLAEQALVGTRGDAESLEEIGRLGVAEADPPDDVHASRRYREHVGAYLVGKAVGAALQEARRG